MFISKILLDDCFLKNNVRLTKIKESENVSTASFVIENIDYDFCFNINFNGTHRDLCSKFIEFANNFDPDKFLENYIKERDCELGAPRSLMEMCEIAKKIQLYLTNTKISIQFHISFTNTDLREDLINETELLYKGAPDGGITDADTLLADKLEQADHKVTGIALEVFRIWKDSSDKGAVEALFYNLTDVEFLDFLDECIEKTTTPTDKIDSIVDYIIKNASYCDGNMWTATDEEICAAFGITKKDFIMIQGDIVDMLVSRKEVCDLNDVGPGEIDISLHKQYCVE